METTDNTVSKIFQCLKKKEESENKFELVADVVGAEEDSEKVSGICLEILH